MTNKETQELIDQLERVKLYYGNYEGDPENEVTKTANQAIQMLMDLPDLE